MLDNDGNLQNEMMVASFAATLLATIPVLLGNEFDVNVGLRRRRSLWDIVRGQGRREEEAGEGGREEEVGEGRLLPRLRSHSKLFSRDQK